MTTDTCPACGAPPGDWVNNPVTTDDDKKFLARFLARGWLAWDRPDNTEHLAVERGIREGLLRRNCSEVHFTAKGRSVLAAFA